MSKTQRSVVPSTPQSMRELQKALREEKVEQQLTEEIGKFFKKNKPPREGITPEKLKNAFGKKVDQCAALLPQKPAKPDLCSMSPTQMPHQVDACAATLDPSEAKALQDEVNKKRK